MATGYLDKSRPSQGMKCRRAGCFARFATSGEQKRHMREAKHYDGSSNPGPLTPQTKKPVVLKFGFWSKDEMKSLLELYELRLTSCEIVEALQERYPHSKIIFRPAGIRHKLKHHTRWENTL